MDPDTSASDEELVARCKIELPFEVVAYRELLKRYEPIVYRTCLKMLGHVQEAEEACQDACLKVFHKIDQFQGRSSFKTWFFRIVYNTCLERRRKLARDSEKLGVVGDAIQKKFEDDRLGHAGRESVAEAMNEALDKLKEEERRIIVLRFISGLSLEEIAEVTELKLSATKMRLYRALDAFKAVYVSVAGLPAGIAPQG